MQEFLKTIIEGEKFELLIDTNIFDKNIILKAVYAFLDKWYFFFHHDIENNIILQFTKKEGVKIKPEIIISNFYEELIAVLLRDTLEKENRVIRETIVHKAINWPLDDDNFVNAEENTLTNEIEFDKDIDDILKDIENDPDLQINEEEIESLLSEIESDEKWGTVKPKIPLNISALADAKKQFKK